MPGTTLKLTAPSDHDLARDVCSYGYFLLAPNRWDPQARAFSRVLELAGGPAGVLIDQRPSGELRARFARRLERSEHGAARAQLARMLCLDVSSEEVRAFHRVDPRWKRSGRARLFRSPTLLEDVIKTVTSCNVAWTSTIHMNRRLCEVCGRTSPTGLHAFPTARRLSRTRPGTLRARCRVGYRDQRMVDLAKLFVRGAIDEAWLSDAATPDDDVFKFLVTLPGIGPYAAGNIMQLLGRYSRLALDTESVRHAKVVLGHEGTDAQILRRLPGHYEPFGVHKFRSYWFELWAFYESKAGPAHTWDRDTTGQTFTAANLNRDTSGKAAVKRSVAARQPRSGARASEARR